VSLDTKLIAERYSKLYEDSPNTHIGSKTEDLTASKNWLIDILSEYKKDFSTVYILGSWYGNLSKMLSLTNRIQIDKIVNVDTNAQSLKDGYHASNIESMNKDANTLDYRQLDKYGAVINTSINDMEGDGWYNNIPKGTFCVFQGRANKNAVNSFDSPEDILTQYPLSKVLSKGAKTLKDDQGEYDRYMVIGYK